MRPSLPNVRWIAPVLWLLPIAAAAQANAVDAQPRPPATRLFVDGHLFSAGDSTAWPHTIASTLSRPGVGAWRLLRVARGGVAGP